LVQNTEFLLVKDGGIVNVNVTNVNIDNMNGGKNNGSIIIIVTFFILLKIYYNIKIIIYIYISIRCR